MGASAVHNTVERYWEKVINNWQRDINDDPFNQYSRKTKDLVEMIIPFGSVKIQLPGKINYRADCCYEIRSRLGASRNLGKIAGRRWW